MNDLLPDTCTTTKLSHPVIPAVSVDTSIKKKPNNVKCKRLQSQICRLRKRLKVANGSDTTNHAADFKVLRISGLQPNNLS